MNTITKNCRLPYTSELDVLVVGKEGIKGVMIGMNRYSEGCGTEFIDTNKSSGYHSFKGNFPESKFTYYWEHSDGSNVPLEDGDKWVPMVDVVEAYFKTL